MLNLDDILNEVFDADGQPVRIKIAPCDECDCYHVIVDDETVCAVCRCMTDRGELTSYLRERVQVFPRIRSDGTYETRDD